MEVPTRDTEWNPAEVSASSSVFDLSAMSEDNIHNSTMVSEINFPSGNNNSMAESETEENAFFQTVPSNQTIVQNISASWESSEEAPRTPKKRESLKKNLEGISSSCKRSKLRKSDVKFPRDTSLEETQMESFSLIRTEHMDSSHSEIHNKRNSLTSQNHLENTQINNEPYFNHSASSTQESDSTAVSHLTYSASELSISPDTSHNDVDSSSLDVSGENSDKIAHKQVHFNLPAIIEAEEEEVIHVPKQAKRVVKRKRVGKVKGVKTRSKSVQANIKIKAPAVPKKPKKTGDPKDNQLKVAEKKVKKAAPKKKNNEVLKEHHEASLDENQGTSSPTIIENLNTSVSAIVESIENHLRSGEDTKIIKGSGKRVVKKNTQKKNNDENVLQDAEINKNIPVPNKLPQNKNIHDTTIISNLNCLESKEHKDLPIDMPSTSTASQIDNAPTDAIATEVPPIENDVSRQINGSNNLSARVEEESSSSYVIDITKECDELKTGNIYITLPSNSLSKVTNIKVKMNRKGKAIIAKTSQEPVVKAIIDLTSEDEKVTVKNEKTGEETKPKLNEEKRKPQLNEEKTKPELNKEKNKPELNEEKTKPKLNEEKTESKLKEEKGPDAIEEKNKEADMGNPLQNPPVQCGYISSGSENSSDSEDCSCSDCEGSSTECSCSDCDDSSSFSESCSCSDCESEDSDYHCDRNHCRHH